MRFRFFVGEVSQRTAIPGNGEFGNVPERGQSRNGGSNSAIQRFQQKTLAILKVLDPCVSLAVPAALSTDESRIVAHIQKLPPRPNGEVFAVSFFPLFELLRRLPIVILAEQFSVRNIVTSDQEFADLIDRGALDC
ncbi:MAG: hypothetical protein WBQ08_11640 [Candidatus Sulfotelmatobacter sp.]